MIQDWHPKPPDPDPAGMTGQLQFRALTACHHLWCTLVLMLKYVELFFIMLGMCPALRLAVIPDA